MNRFGSSESHQPVTHWRGYAIYAAHMLVIGWVASMLLTTLLNFARNDVMFAWLPFDSSLVLRGQVWRVVTYGLVNPPSLGFVFDMAVLIWCGREVERMFGRRPFLVFYALLYILTPVLFTLLGTWWQTGLAGESGAFAVFVALTTLYPNLPMLFNVTAKWVAVILFALGTLQALGSHAWTSLLSLWATCGFAVAWVCHQQGRFSLPVPRWPRRGPKLRVLPDPPARAAAPRRVDPAAEIDALLDKIAKSGLASLTTKEREKLEKHSRDRGRRGGLGGR